MRRLTLAATAAAAATLGLAACATTDRAPEQRSASAQQELDRLLSGKVAGQPVSCLPSYRRQDMVVIDENTILFREGSSRVWRNDVSGPCSGLGTPGRALLTKQFSSSSLCRGEIAQVIDTSQGFTVGSCAIGDFVPYTVPGRG